MFWKNNACLKAFEVNICDKEKTEDRDEGDGFCFKMQVELNYDHNHEMASCDAWNFLEVYQETK